MQVKIMKNCYWNCCQRDSFGLYHRSSHTWSADNTKEVCNGGVACSLIKLGGLEKTVIASLFHSGLHPGNIVEKKVICYSKEPQFMPFFDKKKTKKNMMPNWFFWSFATFFVPTIFWSGTRFCFWFSSMSVLDQTGRI